MKIVLVTRVWPTHRPGGMPHVCYDRAVELAKSHEVHVLTTSRSKKDGEVREGVETIEEGVTVHYLPVPAHRWSREFAEGCLRLTSRLVPDVLHSDSFDREHTWWEERGASVTMHGFGMGAWLTKWNLFRTGQLKDSPPFDADDVTREVEGLRKARRVLGVSRWEWRMLLDQYGLPHDKVRLVYNPIPSYFFDGPLTRNRHGFISVAASQSSTRGLPPLRDLVKKHFPRESYRLLTGLDRRQLPDLYRGTRAILLPTAFAQGYDLSVAEARACGCPAVLSSTGSYLDEAEEFDVSVRLGDEEDLVKGLGRIVSRDFNETSRASFAAATSAEKHRPENHVKEWLSAVS